MRPSAMLVALLLTGCTGEPQPSLPATPQSESPDPATAPAAAAPLDSWSTRIPDTLLVRPGSCPFECCTYREWIAESEIPLRGAARLDAPARADLHPGERFLADSGTVHVTGLMLVALRDTLTSWLGDGPHRYVPGDTLVVLDPLGEGHFNIWYRGAVGAAEGFWFFPGDTVRATTIGEYGRAWWVHATAADGRRGWFLADSVELRGADACGGPY